MNEREREHNDNDEPPAPTSQDEMAKQAYAIYTKVFLNKELCDPEEAGRTITKIIVIITIAVSIEGLVYIFKAGTKDLTLLLYPALLIIVSAILIVALGVYQKLGATIEKEERKRITMKINIDTFFVHAAHYKCESYLRR